MNEVPEYVTGSPPFPLLKSNRAYQLYDDDEIDLVAYTCIALNTLGPQIKSFGCECWSLTPAGGRPFGCPVQV